MINHPKVRGERQSSSAFEKIMEISGQMRVGHILYYHRKKMETYSVQFSHSVMSDFLWPNGLQHARLPCSSPTPRAYSNPCPLHHDAIQPAHPLSSPSPPAFNLTQHQGLRSQFFTSDDQSIGASAAASVLPVTIQD